MLFVGFFSAFVALAMMWTIADATAQESMVVRVFNRDYRVTDIEMHEMLKKADLESHGYKREVTIKLVSASDNDTEVYVKTYFYYKDVSCSKLREIDQELNTLLPGIFGEEVETKINNEITSKHLDAMKQCEAGLEVHFKEDKSCGDEKQSKKRRYRKGATGKQNQKSKQGVCISPGHRQF